MRSGLDSIIKPIAFVFPGQGSQHSGMGLELYRHSPRIKDFFDNIDVRLGFPLTRLCFFGDENELSQTENAQPALVATSLALLQTLSDSLEYAIEPAFVAGHSLGEYAAIAAAGAVEPIDAVRLARLRGLLMQKASESAPGGMVAVIGLDEEALTAVCHESGTWIANLNCPGQIVVSGPKEGLRIATDLAMEKGAKRVIPLKTSGPFHTPLMGPVGTELAIHLAHYRIKPAKTPIVANTAAIPITSPDQIREELVKQLTVGVRWQQSIEFMIASGVTTFFEIGPGQVLANLIRRIDSSVRVISISSLESITQVATLLRG